MQPVICRKEETMDKVTAFDALFTNNQIQKLKVLLSYVDSPMQRQLAIYIKFLELKYTLELFQHSPKLSVSPTPQESPFDPAKLCQEIAPYCTPGEQQQLNQFVSMFQAMSHYQEMMEMVKMFQEMFPEGISFPGAEAADGGFGDHGSDDGGDDNSKANGFPGGMSPDMMAAGLSGLFGGNMPDLSQLMSMMNMMQPAEPPPPEDK